MLPLLVVTGPTATGKTAVGIELALRLKGEVISADSMLVYRHMDIGTAKPDLEERRGVPHHLIDIVDPDEEFSVADFQVLAHQKIREVAGRGKLPLLVGGTGLYIRALAEEYQFTEMDPDSEFRRRLAEEARVKGGEGLHGRLREVDPDAAARIHPNDSRRLIRALEVYEKTGRPISSSWGAPARPSPYDLVMVGITADRQDLYRRIELRVDRMIAAGLVEEVRSLLGMGYTRDLKSMQSLGYREIAAYLDGETDLPGAVELIKINTRRFAKRQLTWFRRDRRINWLPVGKDSSVEQIVEGVLKIVEGKWGKS
ncbi:MAG: tRNA (adenosine(37)-N6)-dimethylallyltransferase MiaA [Actinobacteria bacterium]|nr:tRNA (adenosine(37)-N6)-dimethylallyltransferase MiaA [Actinomycetota bacterium]